MDTIKQTCPVCSTQDVIVKNGQGYFACGYRRNMDGCNSECGAFGPTKCTCDIKELFWGGCKCGWLAIEKAKK